MGNCVRSEALRGYDEITFLDLPDKALAMICNSLSWIEWFRLLRVDPVLQMRIKKCYVPTITKVDLGELGLLIACKTVRLGGRWDIYFDRLAAVESAKHYAKKKRDAGNVFSMAIAKGTESVLKICGQYLIEITTDGIFGRLEPFDKLIDPNLEHQILRMAYRYCPCLEHLTLPEKLHMAPEYWKILPHFQRLKFLKLSLREEDEKGLDGVLSALSYVRMINVAPSKFTSPPTLGWLASISDHQLEELEIRTIWDKMPSRLVGEALSDLKDSLQVVKLTFLGTDDDFRWIERSIPNLCNLQVLHLGAASSKRKNIMALVDMIYLMRKDDSKLRVLHLHGRLVQGVVIEAISIALTQLTELALTRGVFKGYEPIPWQKDILLLSRLTLLNRLTLDFLQTLDEVIAIDFVSSLQVASLNLVAFYRMSNNLWDAITRVRSLRLLIFECVIVGESVKETDYVNRTLCRILNTREDIPDRGVLYIKLGPHVDVRIEIPLDAIADVPDVWVHRRKLESIVILK